jgi:hypothetical protein
MDEALVRATLEVSGHVDVELPGGGKRVVTVVRATDWRGSPVWSDYLLWLGFSRLWRLVRMDRRWFVEVSSSPPERKGRGEVRAVAESKEEAIRRGVGLAVELRATRGDVR